MADLSTEQLEQHWADVARVLEDADNKGTGANLLPDENTTLAYVTTSLMTKYYGLHLAGVAKDIPWGVEEWDKFSNLIASIDTAGKAGNEYKISHEEIIIFHRYIDFFVDQTITLLLFKTLGLGL
jgi:hypothetical protein